MSDDKNYKRQTRLMHAGRNPEDYYGVVNPPICRTSTILYDSMAAYFDPKTKYRYGRMGNPLANAFEEAMSELEGGYHAVTTPSGLSAITTAFLSFVKAGDHVLIADSCYPPTRFFAKQQLQALGVDVEFYDPLVGEGISDLIRNNTSIIYMESPGSATFEVQDVPAITQIAKRHDILTIVDNTYAAGILFRPLEHGVDLCVQSAAKYVSGHSDVNLGVVVARTEALYKRLKAGAVNLGVCGGAEDIYMALRGFRTLEMRLRAAQENVKPVFDWFKGRDEVHALYSPIIETAPGHDIWRRDFSGSNGLFSVLFKPDYTLEDVSRFVDSLSLFPVGSSWGGYETLVQPQDMKSYRSQWDKQGVLIRFQIGHEATEDLLADLEQGIGALKG